MAQPEHPNAGRCKHDGIHPTGRNAKTIQRRKANHTKNKAIRANLYRDHCGEAANKAVGEWHSTLRALSTGSA